MSPVTATALQHQTVIAVDMFMLEQLESACNQMGLRSKSRKIFNNIFYSVKSPIFLSVPLSASYLKVESSKYTANKKGLGESQVILISTDLQAFMSHILKRLASHLPAKLHAEHAHFDYESDDHGHVYMKLSEKVQLFNASKHPLKADSWIFGHYNAKFMIQVYGIYLYTSESDDDNGGEMKNRKMVKLSAKIVQIMCLEKVREPELQYSNLPCLF